MYIKICIQPFPYKYYETSSQPSFKLWSFPDPKKNTKKHRHFCRPSRRWSTRFTFRRLHGRGWGGGVCFLGVSLESQMKKNKRLKKERYCWWFRNPKQPLFGCIKACKWWDKLPTSTVRRISSINSMSYLLSTWNKKKKPCRWKADRLRTFSWRIRTAYLNCDRIVLILWVILTFAGIPSHFRCGRRELSIAYINEVLQWPASGSGRRWVW